MHSWDGFEIENSQVELDGITKKFKPEYYI